jgi:hypothetical protein
MKCSEFDPDKFEVLQAGRKNAVGEARMQSSLSLPMHGKFRTSLSHYFPTDDEAIQ